ncbi:MAG: 16S rRNA (cytosine(1402)-N(4))-methyltransferase RsmH [Acidimicrobiales bacterium]
MSQEFSHTPVMVQEVLDLLATVPPGPVIDATVGGGGHAARLLGANPGMTIVGLDRDETALEAAAGVLVPFGARAVLVRANFAELAQVAATFAPDGASAVLFDLGVSSAQFDQAERGFSYRFDAPLDMRMDRRGELDAAQVVNSWSVAELARIFAANGEGRFARRIALAIEEARPLATTGELSDVVRAAIPAPARRKGGHPAKKVFQAIRIAVNDELSILGPSLGVGVDALVKGGRAVVLSYHSGEDRIVKEVFGQAVTGGCTCPVPLGCVCGAVGHARHLLRGRRPSREELASNPRASSARMRAIEKLAVQL